MAALTVTTLAADLGANDTIVKLTSGTGFPAVGGVFGNNQYRMQIDGEFMYVVEMIDATTARVRSRGADGTVAVPHDKLAAVAMGAPADFNTYPYGADNPRPPYADDIASYGEDGAIAVPNKNTTVFLTKATAGAYTLAAPTLAQDGVRLTIASKTDAAHVITATGLVADGATGSPEDVITLAAFKGAGCVLVAGGGLWHVVSGAAATATVT